MVGGLGCRKRRNWRGALYGAIFNRTVPVSSPAAAEMTKLLENIYRCVNIALVNELKLLCLRMGIDIWEVIEAASTKPFGFHPFYPGPGLGGHCIPVDPFYLSWKAKEWDFRTRFIELAGEINTNMPYHVLESVQRRVEPAQESGEWIASAWCWAWPTRKTLTICANRRRSPSSNCCRKKARRSATTIRISRSVGKGRKYDLQMKCADLWTILDSTIAC